MIRFVSLATISAAILAYEVLLTRLFAIVQWHHFAFMAISIALLGFGVSAAALALWRKAAELHLNALFVVGAVTFAVTSPAAFLLAQHIPFNALELVWDPTELLGLGAIYVVLAIPFTAGAVCIGIAFLRREDPVGHVYFWNLFGSALGVLGVVVTLSTLPPVWNLAAVSALGLIAAALGLVAGEGRRKTVAGIAVLLLGTAGWMAAPSAWLTLNVTEQKGLSVALNVAGAELAEERFGPLGLITVVESPIVPFRSAPGLSLNAPHPPPEQVAVFTDAGAMTVIDANAGRDPASYLRYTTDALVYSLVDRPDVLVLGAGGGREIAQALAHDAARIDAIEPNPDFVDLMQDEYAAFSGDLYARDEVHVRATDPRGFLAATEGQWNVIIVGGAGAHGAGTGAHGLSESYLLTVDAMALMLRRLSPGGWLSFTQALELPPRNSLKLMLTALEALERQGATNPAEHLVLIRGMTTTTLLVGRDPVGARAIGETAAFVEARSFDLAYYAGMTRDAANRFNLLAEPLLFDAAIALSGSGQADFVERYKFDIEAATDDRPYFFDFFRWRSLPELLAMRSVGGAALLELGQLILIGTFAQALVISLVLILLPLRLGGLAQGRRPVVWATGAYFTAIGLAFFFVEVAFIQKFILFMGHPTYALAVVLAGFLVFAGIGAWASEHSSRLIAARLGLDWPMATIDIAVVGVVVVAIGYLIVAPPIFAALSGLPTAGRALVSLALIAPLAFFMGMPFPLGLTLIRRAEPALTAWAWGVNGCASVNSAILAVLLAMHMGYVAVIAIALVLYVIATRTIRGIASLSQSQEAGAP